MSGAAAHQRFDPFLERLSGFFVGSDDQDGVVAGDGAGGFRKFGSIDSGGEGLRASGRRFQDEQIYRGANVQKELAERASQRRQAVVGFLRQRGGGAVAFLGFDEAKFLEIAGKRGLRNAQFLRGEAAAQLFLIGDGSVGNEAQDLAVAKCFASIHGTVKICTHLYIYTAKAPGMSMPIWDFPKRTARTGMDGTEVQLMQDSHHC